jgi:hypothetical protein
VAAKARDLYVAPPAAQALRKGNGWRTVFRHTYCKLIALAQSDIGFRFSL